MNLALFYVWEDVRVWAHWNHSRHDWNDSLTPKLHLQLKLELLSASWYTNTWKKLGKREKLKAVVNICVSFTQYYLPHFSEDCSNSHEDSASLPPILPGRTVWDDHPPPLFAPKLFSSPRASFPICSLSCSQLWVWDKQNPGFLAVSADKKKFSLGAAEPEGCRLSAWACQRLEPISASVAEVRAERYENTISDRLGCLGPRSHTYLFSLTLSHLVFLGNNNQKYSTFKKNIFQLQIYLYSTSEPIYTQHHPLLLSGLFSSQQR